MNPAQSVPHSWVFTLTFPLSEILWVYSVFISETCRREQQVWAVDKDCMHAWLCAYPGTPGSSWL